MQEHKNKSNKWQTIEAIIIDIIVASIIVIAIIITTKILFGKQIKKAIEVVDMVSINSENSIIPERMHKFKLKQHMEHLHIKYMKQK